MSKESIRLVDILKDKRVEVVQIVKRGFYYLVYINYGDKPYMLDIRTLYVSEVERNDSKE